MSSNSRNRRIGTLAAMLAAAYVAGCANGDGAGDVEVEQTETALTQTCLPSNIPAGYFLVPNTCKYAVGGSLAGTPTGCTCAQKNPSSAHVDFDWTVPPQTGVDSDGDGIANISPKANPPGEGTYMQTVWPVTLDGCSTTPAPSYTFTLNGVGTSTGGSCSVGFTVPAQGSYHATFTAHYGNGDRTVNKDITVKNYLIVSIGDSIASGEGNPDVPGSGTSARWENVACDRSNKSGPALAALQLENADPHSSVTFLSQACSGAEITPNGLLGPYQGQNKLPNSGSFMAQVSAVARVVCPVGANLATMPVNTVKSQCRQIDALLVNAGANDMGFGDVVQACADPTSDCINSGDFATSIPKRLALLPNTYSSLSKTINSMLPVKNVFISEYPDPTQGDNETLCSQMVFPGGVGDNAGWVKGLLAPLAGYSGDGIISAHEIQWLHDNFLVPMNNTIKSSAIANGWFHIGGIADEFVNHGYCATKPWIVTYGTSKANQGNMLGTMHPNLAGQQVYQRHIYHALLDTLATGLVAGKRIRNDMDKDGRSDITLTGGVGWGSMPIAFSNGDGTFRGTNGNATDDPNFGVYAQQAGARAFSGDFDGDGRADIALTGGIGWGSIPVAFSKGDGTYHVTNLGTATFPGLAAGAGVVIVAGDFNGDHKTDLLLDVPTTGGINVPIALSNGDGTFRMATWGTKDYAVTGWGPNQKRAVGDFNGDGFADIAYVSSTGVTVGYSDGTGLFTGRYCNKTCSDLQLGGLANVPGAKAVAGDFNGDGIDDIALVGGEGWATIPMALSNGDMTWGAQTFHFINAAMDGKTGTDSKFPNYATLEGAKPVAGDFNGDGIDDIALTGGAGWGGIPVAFSNADGTFHPTNLAMRGGDTNFPVYAGQVGATPSAIYAPNQVVQINHWINDSATQCTVGGVSMHCCPNGSAMIGIRPDQNVFKCAPLSSPGGAITLDTGTQRNNMHACPFGQVMVGLHADRNLLACQALPASSFATEEVDSATNDSFPMHVCNDTRDGAMTGIRLDQNLLNCTVGN